jgi:myo-inositol 2-dehydrogenase / D-chiro-inositol 1-dehydrogenase
MTATRVGLVGAGGVAQRHARVLSGLPDVQVIGVTDVVPAAAEALAGAYDARVFPDVGALLSAGLDAAYVCVPPFAHGPAERAIVAAEVPLFVEKPIAIDQDTADEIAAFVAERQLLTAVGHHWRYADGVERARRLLAGRPVRLVTGGWLDKVPPVGWWPRRDRSGGPVVEQAAHVLDLARHLAGEVTDVYAYGNGTPPDVPGADVDGATAAALRFASGAVGTLAATCVLGWKERAGLDVYADGLAVRITETSVTVRDGDTESVAHCDPDAARIAVDRAFIDAVRGDRNDVRVSYPEAIGTHALALAVAESAATGRPVRPRIPEPARG